METFFQDFRHGLRRLAKEPGFALVAIFTLALGIGGNAAIYSIVDGVLLARPPFPDADSLVWITERSAQFPTMSVAYPNFLDWRAETTSFSHLSAHRDEVYNVTGLERAEQVSAIHASASLFPMLGVEAAVGRVFGEKEDRAGGPRVVVLTHRYWQTRFGGDLAVVGRTVSLDGEPWEIIGVAPPGFFYPLQPSSIFCTVRSIPAHCLPTAR